MLTYLARNTCPDIEHAVHRCAKFQYDSRGPHGKDVTLIGRYIIATKDKGKSYKLTND